jgi:hypothetical protein
MVSFVGLFYVFNGISILMSRFLDSKNLHEILGMRFTCLRARGEDNERNLGRRRLKG